MSNKTRKIDKNLSDFPTEIEGLKATPITGSYLRIDKDILADFNHKASKSKHEPTKGQSKREIIIQMFLERYNEKGDNIFNIIDSKPF